MADLEPSNNPITANGTYSIGGLVSAGRYAVTASGTFGGGSLAINWNDGTNSVGYDDSPLSEAGGIEVVVPKGKLDFVLTGATTPSIVITVKKIS